MLKETIICIIIIILIFTFDFITQGYTERNVDEISNKLDNLKKEIIEKDILKEKEDIKNINNKWKNAEEKLAYYIEHDELEKVNSELKELTSYIESEDEELSIAKIEKAIFILEHIKDKNSFSLENIF